MSTDNAILASLARIENLLSQILAARHATYVPHPAPAMPAWPAAPAPWQAPYPCSARTAVVPWPFPGTTDPPPNAVWCGQAQNNGGA